MADREGRGFLYPKKNRKEGQPAMTGKALLDGRQIDIAGWGETSQNGVRYLSLKVQYADQGTPAAQSPAPEPSPPDDDDIPF